MNPAKLFSTLLNVNPRVATLIASGLVFLASAAIVISWNIDLQLAIQTAGVILAFSVLAVIFANITGLIARLLAWIAFLIFTAYALILFAQFICGSCMTPPIRAVGCLVSPFTEGCLESTAGEVAVAQGRVSSAPIETAAAEPQAQETFTRSLTVEEPDQKEGNRVFIHFAGSMARQDVVEMAKALESSGWNVQQSDNGGERITSAYGLNEVRVFHKTDIVLAKKLAQDLNAVWEKPDGIAVKSLAGTRYTSEPKHLEIWISD